MTDHPILFSGPMIRALWEGRKTMTRRLLKLSAAANPHGAAIPSYYDRVEVGMFEPDAGEPRIFGAMLSCHGRGSVLAPLPRRVGDRIWVREAWRTEARNDDIKPSRLRVGLPVYYEAGDFEATPECAGRLRSSIHMPRWASRFTLTVTQVRVELLNDISEADAIAEGLEREPSPLGASLWFVGASTKFSKAVPAYAALWESLHGKGAWAENPWVAILTFTVARANIDTMPKSEAA